MFETIVIATDGSSSAERAVRAALDLAERFDATVHALYVVDAGEVAGSPDDLREEFERALTTQGGRALSFVRERAAADGDREVEADEVVTAVREGDPTTEICQYGADHDADVLVTGTRGRHGEHGFLLGSVAEGVVRKADAPVMTVRQLEGGEEPA